MAIEGPLKELGLHDVFQLLDLSRKTGVLRVTSPLRRNQGTVYFDQGAVVAAEIRSNPHPLGELLLRSGKITDAELERARATQQSGDNRRLGEILVELGAVGQRELERLVRMQIEEVVFEVIGWREGYFSFVEGPLGGLRTEVGVRIPTEALLMEGARRIDEWSRIERQVPHLGVVPALATGAAQREAVLDLRPPEWEVLALIDGNRDLREMAAAIGRSEFDVAKTVFGLYSSGVVTLEDPRRVEVDVARPQRIEDTLAEVGQLLDAGEVETARLEAEALAAGYPNDPRTHLAAAHVQLAAGHAREAEAAARRALGLDPALSDAHRLLGDALLAQGQFGDAAAWWERWLGLPRDVGDDPRLRGRVTEALTATRALQGYLKGHNDR
jgi:hypothetical protein